MSENTELNSPQANSSSYLTHYEIPPSICPSTGQPCVRAIEYLKEFDATSQAEAISHVSVEDSGIIESNGRNLVRRMAELDRAIEKYGCSDGELGGICMAVLQRNSERSPQRSVGRIPRILTLVTRK
jgi:hypothetical protein